MQDRLPPVTPQVVEIVDRTVRESMQPFGFQSVGVRAGLDHDGDPVLFIDAEYVLSETPIDPAVTSNLLTKLRDRLWDAGETRFPHIRHNFDENQQVRSRRKKKA